MIGQTLGHYRIESKLGEGGMGVVYKALDTHLNRTVAIKVLPTEAVADPGRRQRFVQEAHAASALDHPNIITIYDIAEADGQHFIVMQYVAGKTLRELLRHGALALSDALRYAVQMADALAQAHARGIVHRDLKPENVMVTEQGQVKILDFGLAKLTEHVDDDQFAATQPMKPNQPARTEEGTIVGTVAYMSPEQTEGKKVDARSDIFSFGSVLYEMVTGRRAFQGQTKISTLSAILHREPQPVSEIAATVPADLEKLIGRCLRKDLERRLQHMDDVKLALEELREESGSGKLEAAGAPPARRLRPVWVSALVVAAMAAAAGWFWLRLAKVPLDAPMTVVPLTSYPGREAEPSLSPDGNQVAFSWNGEKQDNFDIYVKLTGPGAPLRLTTDPAEDFSPAWSPDGRSIAFFRGARSSFKFELFLIGALGGPERKLSEIVAAGLPRASWAPDGKWLVLAKGMEPSSASRSVLYLLSVQTGEERRLTTPPEKWRGDFSPAFSPDGRSVVFTRSPTLRVGDLYQLALTQDGKPSGEPRRLTFDDQWASEPAWMPDGREIVYSQVDGSLWRIAVGGGGAREKAARIGSVGDDASSPTISRAGTGSGFRLVYTRSSIDSNIWRVPAAGGAPSSFIASTRADQWPQFSPDGRRILFLSDRSGSFEIWTCDSNGANAVQLTSRTGLSPFSFPHWSPDGERIVFTASVQGQSDVYVIRANGGEPRRLTNDPAEDGAPTWSRDGKWIYFVSKRSGRFLLWKMLANGGDAIQMQYGWDATESADGKFLFYRKGGFGNATLWKAPIAGGEETQVLDANHVYVLVEDGIYFIPATAGPQTSIQFLDFRSAAASRAGRQIVTIEKPVGLGLTISPDRQWILYSQIDSSGSDLMLVENFR